MGLEAMNEMNEMNEMFNERYIENSKNQDAGLHTQPELQ